MAVSFHRVLCVRSDGTSGSDDFTVNRPLKVFDVHGIVVTQAATTTTLQRGSPLFVAVSNALTDNAAAGVLLRAAVLAPAQSSFVATDVMRFLGSGAGRQQMFAMCIPT
jgi:hypothetical protein